MNSITIQPAQGIDPEAEYDVMKPVPYPYHIEDGGLVGRQDFWRGSPSRLLGFQRGNVQSLVLTYEEFVAEPQRAKGLCAVFIDEPSQMDKRLLTGLLNPAESPKIWADPRPIIRVTEHTPEAADTERIQAENREVLDAVLDSGTFEEVCRAINYIAPDALRDALNEVGARQR